MACYRVSQLLAGLGGVGIKGIGVHVQKIRVCEGGRSNFEGLVGHLGIQV